MPRVRCNLPVIAGLMVAFSAPAALPEVRSSVNMITYDVAGDSLADVWRDINRKAPQVLQNTHAQAETRIRYRWKVSTAFKGQDCAAARPVVDVMVTIVLPSWRSVRSAPAAAQAAWQRYIAEIRRHEDVHRAIAVETANALEAMIRRAPPHGSCTAIARFIDSSAQRILAEERRRQTRFDHVSPMVRLPDMSAATATHGR